MTALQKARARIARLTAMIRNLRRRVRISDQGRTVWHDKDPNVARPAIPDPIVWVGTVEPANWRDHDIWIDSDSPDWQDQLAALSKEA